jgi:hypothetical protein
MVYVRRYIVGALLLCLVSSGCIAQSLDSLNGAPSIERLDSIVFKQQRRLDSLQQSTLHSFFALKHSYDSISETASLKNRSITIRIDSLNALNLPTDKLRLTLDSVSQFKTARLDSITNKVEALKARALGTLDGMSLTEDLTVKTRSLNSAIGKLDASLPVPELPNLDFNELPPGFSRLDNQLTGLNSPTIPNLNLPDASLPKVENPLSNQSNPGVPQVNLPIEISGDVTAPLDQYQQQLSSALPTGLNSLPGSLEENARDMADMDAIEEQIGNAEGMGTLPVQPTDPEALKERAVTEVRKQAVNHFAGKEEQLQQAMDRLSTYKKKYASIQNIADLADKRPNEMRDRSFVERLVPGLAFQIGRRDDWLLDVNPYLGYRFNGRLTIGAGWNQRIAYNTDSQGFNPESRIYGPRAYGEYGIGKGFCGRLELEYMNTHVPPPFASNPENPTGREWVFGALAGMKKQYRITSHLRGTIVLLYSLYDPDHRSPYGNRLNMRFGVELRPTRGTKQPATDKLKKN